VVWNVKFIKYRENKLTITRYIQNVHHWHELKHASVLAIAQPRHQSATAPRRLATHAEDAVALDTHQFNIMNVTVTPYYVACKINNQIAYLQRAFIPVSRYVKLIKIHEDFPEL